MDTTALYKISYGLYVIGAEHGNISNAQIANTLIQVCSKPLMVSICLNRQNFTHDLLSKSKSFSASVLAQDTPLNFIGALGFKSGRDGNKLGGINRKKGQTGAPVVVDHALAYIEAEVKLQLEVETHTIFVGEVVAAEVLGTGEPMTYAYYQQVKKGTTPVTAPSYIEKKGEGLKTMDKYECQVCGYVYDPKVGDPESSTPPGTAFEALPDSWTCPVCGASKDEFKKI